MLLKTGDSVAAHVAWCESVVAIEEEGGDERKVILCAFYERLQRSAPSEEEGEMWAGKVAGMQGGFTYDDDPKPIDPDQ